MKKMIVFNRKTFVKDIIITSVIAILPFLFFLYNFIPKVEVWKTSFFTFDSSEFSDAQTFFWLIFSKLLLIFLLFIWFITCKHWWKSVILIPTCIELYKLISVIAIDSNGYFDEYEFIDSLPITIPIIIILFFISRKLNYYSRSKNLNAELNDEISELLQEVSSFKKENHTSFKKSLSELRSQKKTMQKEEYLRNLIELRNGLTRL